MGGLGEEQILALAPDASSVKAARGLARPGPWSDTGATETLLWGSCQGSGKKPYQVSVDLTGPSAKCSCPSRKFPCKHGLALLLLWAGGHVVAAASGSLLLGLMWVAEWPLARFTPGGDPTGSTNPLVESHVISALALIVVAMTYAGTTWGFGKLWARIPFVSRRPWAI